MKTFAINGRCAATPPPPDWREQLAVMLGAKPRRIGVWAELALYGALRCMADAGEKTLASQAILLLSSRHGPYVAVATVIEQMRDSLPMPLSFLQTQPSQVLALLAAQLNWHGHACFVAGATPEELLPLAGAQTTDDGVLLGWVEETTGGSTHWLRLRPHIAFGTRGRDVSGNKIFSHELNYLCIGNTGLQAI